MRRAAVRIFIAGLAFVALFAAPAAAYLDNVTVTPAAPRAGEPAVVQAEGWLPDPCWSLLGQEVRTAERLVVLSYETAYVAPTDVGCIAVIVPYEVAFEHVFTAAGEWTVRVVEHRRGPFAPLPDMVIETTVNVEATAPTDPVTWSTLKATYR